MKGPVTACQGIEIFLSWAMVMGRQQGRVGSSGVSGLLRVVCEEERVGSRCRCCGRDVSPSFDVNNDPWPRAPTCRRTLAVSSGKVRRSAKQAAMPAPRNFTAVVGGISEGFSPTMVPDVSPSPLRAQFRFEERGRSAALGFRAGRRLWRQAGGGRWNQCCLAQHQEGLYE